MLQGALREAQGKRAARSRDSQAEYIAEAVQNRRAKGGAYRASPQGKRKWNPQGHPGTACTVGTGAAAEEGAWRCPPLRKRRAGGPRKTGLQAQRAATRAAQAQARRPYRTGEVKAAHRVRQGTSPKRAQERAGILRAHNSQVEMCRCKTNAPANAVWGGVPQEAPQKSIHGGRKAQGHARRRHRGMQRKRTREAALYR